MTGTQITQMKRRFTLIFFEFFVRTIRVLILSPLSNYHAVE